ncbi:hypothetical protein [Sphingobacterium detergens]
MLFISILLISCWRNQSTSMSNEGDIGVTIIDSSENNSRITSNNESIQQYVDTLSIPSKYIVTVPLEFNNKKMEIRLRLIKSETLSRGKNYTIPEIEENANSYLPKSASDCILGTIDLQHWRIISKGSFYETYDYYKHKDFKENDFVGREKMIFHHGGFNFITITDVDLDGYEDLLILDLSESMRDNEVYQFYKWSREENKFIFIPDFFNKSAFYGWDKTGKYLITGVSDTRERKLYKNKIVRGKLKIVEQCTEYAVSDKFCW